MSLPLAAICTSHIEMEYLWKYQSFDNSARSFSNKPYNKKNSVLGSLVKLALHENYKVTWSVGFLYTIETTKIGKLAGSISCLISYMKHIILLNGTPVDLWHFLFCLLS